MKTFQPSVSHRSVLRPRSAFIYLSRVLCKCARASLAAFYNQTTVRKKYLFIVRVTCSTPEHELFAVRWRWSLQCYRRVTQMRLLMLKLKSLSSWDVNADPQTRRHIAMQCSTRCDVCGDQGLLSCKMESHKSFSVLTCAQLNTNPASKSNHRCIDSDLNFSNKILMHNTTDSSLVLQFTGVPAHHEMSTMAATLPSDQGVLFFFFYVYKAQFTTASHKSEHT